jgi:hypothetical protein
MTHDKEFIDKCAKRLRFLNFKDIDPKATQEVIDEIWENKLTNGVKEFWRKHVREILKVIEEERIIKMEIKILSKERDQIIQLVNTSGKVLFELEQTYDEMGSAGREAAKDVAVEFGKALSIPCTEDDMIGN